MLSICEGEKRYGSGRWTTAEGDGDRNGNGDSIVDALDPRALMSRTCRLICVSFLKNRPGGGLAMNAVMNLCFTPHLMMAEDTCNIYIL